MNPWIFKKKNFYAFNFYQSATSLLMNYFNWISSMIQLPLPWTWSFNYAAEIQSIHCCRPYSSHILFIIALWFSYIIPLSSISIFPFRKKNRSCRWYSNWNTTWIRCNHKHKHIAVPIVPDSFRNDYNLLENNHKSINTRFYFDHYFFASNFFFEMHPIPSMQ